MGIWRGHPFNFRRATEIRSEIIGDLLQVTQILRFELPFIKKTTTKGAGSSMAARFLKKIKKAVHVFTFS